MRVGFFLDYKCLLDISYTYRKHFYSLPLILPFRVLYKGYSRDKYYIYSKRAPPILVPDIGPLAPYY
jgi:hypothetical protein